MSVAAQPLIERRRPAFALVDTRHPDRDGDRLFRAWPPPPCSPTAMRRRFRRRWWMRKASALFSGEDISEGQAVFLKYGLMANGSIWGHGAYLGPDYSAEALHRMGEDTAEAIAQQQYRQPWAALTRSQQAAVRAETAVALKTNRYDAATATLHLTAPEAAAYREADRLLDRLFPPSSAQWRPEGRPHHRPDRAAPVHRLRHLGRLGIGRRPSRRGLFLYQQLSVRPERRQSAHARRAVVERAEPDRAAGRHRRGAAGIRQIRLPGLDHSRPSRAPATAAGAIQPRPARAGEILRGRGACCS